MSNKFSTRHTIFNNLLINELYIVIKLTIRYKKLIKYGGNFKLYKVHSKVLKINWQKYIRYHEHKVFFMIARKRNG